MKTPLRRRCEAFLRRTGGGLSFSPAAPPPSSPPPIAPIAPTAREDTDAPQGKAGFLPALHSSTSRKGGLSPSKPQGKAGFPPQHLKERRAFPALSKAVPFVFSPAASPSQKLVRIPSEELVVPSACAQRGDQACLCPKR